MFNISSCFIFYLLSYIKCNILEERMSQGMNTKNITPYVMDTLEGEIGRIVGYSVKVRF